METQMVKWQEICHNQNVRLCCRIDWNFISVELDKCQDLFMLHSCYGSNGGYGI